MKQIFHNYTLWEDYKAGMYDPPCIESVSTGVTTNERIELARVCLSNPTLCDEYMKKVIDTWKYATEQVLTDKSCNRRAWLGWSACNLYANCKQEETCQAWWLLTEKERNKANKIADKYIKIFEKSHEDFIQIELE